MRSCHICAIMLFNAFVILYYSFVVLVVAYRSENIKLVQILILYFQSLPYFALLHLNHAVTLCIFIMLVGVCDNTLMCCRLTYCRGTVEIMTDSLMHSLLYSLIHSLLHSFLHSLLYSFVHSLLLYSFIHCCIHSFIHCCIHSFLSLIHI